MHSAACAPATRGTGGLRHSRSRRAIVTLAIGALALLVVSPSMARAQIGALARKAAAKAARQAAGMSGVGADAPAFDHQLLELTDERVSAVIAGVQATQRLTAPDGSTRAQLIARAGAANEQRNALLEKRDDDLRRYDEEVHRVNLCTQAILDSLNRQHNEAMARKAQTLAASADPMGSKLMQDVMAATTESQRLMAQGDTAGALAVQRSLMKKHGIDPARDSTVASTRCGALPSRAAWHRQADSLLAVANGAMRLAQDMDRQSATAGARAASMTTQQFAIARERLQAFASTNGNPSSSWRFSATERKVLLARLQQLKAIA